MRGRVAYIELHDPVSAANELRAVARVVRGKGCRKYEDTLDARKHSSKATLANDDVICFQSRVTRHKLATS